MLRRHPARYLPIAIGLLLLVTLNSATSTASANNDRPANSEQGESHTDACVAPAVSETARCHAKRRTDPTGTPSQAGAAKQPKANPNILGNNGAYDPSYLQAAYNLTSLASGAGAGQTVAIVDAYDDPTALTDVATYRSFFGLPALLPCGSATGPWICKANQAGSTTGPYPAANAGWAQEISLDLDMVSAICPRCNILLVEANSNTYVDLGTAVNRAALMGAKEISNSYGGGEFSGETTYESQYYNHPGVAVTVSSGDSGYGVEFPASSQYVTAVGGTSLQQADPTTTGGTRSATETVWSGAGSGCSAYVSKPSWQTDTGCSRRTVADVAAVADPATGVWVQYAGSWYIFGGTSVASPIISATYALAGNGSVNYGSAPYKNPASLNDVVSGSNGSCGGSYLCTASVGYDGPTGLGTPNGIASFQNTSGSLSFSTTPQTLAAGNASGPIAVQLLPAAPVGGVTLNLSSNSSGGGFSLSTSGFTGTLAVTITAGSTSSPTFYYQDTKAGTPVLTAMATGYTSGTQTETVSAGALSSISVAPASAIVGLGQQKTFTASGVDGFGNPVSVSSAAWSVTAPGTVSPTTGSSTTFTASSSTTGSGQVIASVGSTSGTASVTVSAVVTVPSAPTGLVAAADTSQGIVLTWNAPANNGGSPITSYRIYRSRYSGSESFLVSVTCTTSTCTYHDTSTRSGRRYFYTLAAVNAAGMGALSNEANAIAK